MVGFPLRQNEKGREILHGLFLSLID